MDNIKIPKKRGRKPKNLSKSNTNLENSSSSTNSNVDNNVDSNVDNNNNKILEEAIPVEKKKRGRKPKIKIEEEPKIPKKRGRKPKPKTAEDLLPKVLKKRGRKPKENSYSIVKEIVNLVDDENDNLIMHLPIHSSELNPLSEFDENRLLKYNPDMTEPMPYTPCITAEILNYKKGENEGYNILNTEQLQYSQFNNTTNNTNNSTVSDKDSISDDLAFENNTEDNISINDYNNYINNYNKDSSLFKNRIKKNRDHDSHTNFNIETNNPRKKFSSLLEEFSIANYNNEYPETTEINCWWCSHPFDDVPVSLPHKYSNGRFNVYGVFCSYNCACSYNFADEDSHNDKVWERYSLLNLLYKKIHDCKVIKVKMAAPRQTLKKFGGPLSIEEFRKNNKTNERTYKLVLPPLVSIIPQIEETINLDRSIPIDKMKMRKADIAMKLKRNKPLLNANKTLESYMMGGN